jgi:hypothetical protein
MTTLKRLRGLQSLVQDAVEHGSKAVEDVHKATAGRTFVVLEAIPPIARPARAVHRVHDVSLSGVYGMIRVVNRVVGMTLEVALDVADQRAEGAAAASGTVDP